MIQFSYHSYMTPPGSEALPGWSAGRSQTRLCQPRLIFLVIHIQPAALTDTGNGRDIGPRHRAYFHHPLMGSFVPDSGAPDELALVVKRAGHPARGLSRRNEGDTARTATQPHAVKQR